MITRTPTPDHPYHQQQTFHVRLLRDVYPDANNIEAGAAANELAGSGCLIWRLLQRRWLPIIEFIFSVTISPEGRFGWG